LKKDISSGIEDLLVDITSFEDKTLDEGYGTGGDRPVGMQSGNIVHQNMIKRCGIYSQFILFRKPYTSMCVSIVANTYGL
jgi:transcription initiation factor TFIIH subunit 1